MGSVYKQEDGKFHLFNDVERAGKVVSEFTHASESVAVAWSRIEDQASRLHIFTHGTAEGMKAWVEAHNRHSPHKATLKVFDQATPLETVNRAISDPDFLSTLL